MKKIILATLVLLSVSSFAVAQQSPVIEKAIKDPNRKANEAKADRVVMDSVKKQVNQPANPDKSKKKSCCTKKRTGCSNDKKKSS